MAPAPVLRRSAVYVCLGSIAILFCSTRESFGVIIRYSESGTIPRDFSVTPTSGAEEILSYLVLQGKFEVTANPEGDPAVIVANLNTSNLKRIVGGFPIESITPYKLAQYAGYYTFNWRQHVLGGGQIIPMEVNGGGQPLPTSGPVLDPILNWSNSHQTVYRRIISTPPAPPPNWNDTYIGIKPDEEDLFVDNHEPYYTIAGMAERNSPTFEPYRRFHDRPDGDWLTNGATFLTELVGVDANNDVIADWSGLGVNFTWNSNAVSGVSGIGHSGVDGGGPPIISGGVFNVAIIAGDFNKDGVVDAADYVAWRKTDGTPSHYDVWRANFGQPTSGSGTLIASVPEPSTFVLCLAAIFATQLRRSRKR